VPMISRDVNSLPATTSGSAWTSTSTTVAPHVR
jgi:hypothetical protein